MQSSHSTSTPFAVWRTTLTGLPSVGGRYETYPHAWNIDPFRGLVIDLTADQFGSVAPVLVASEGPHLPKHRGNEHAVGWPGVNEEGQRIIDALPATPYLEPRDKPLRGLRVARQVLEERIDGFPTYCCVIASTVTQEVFGFEMQRGVYVPEDYNRAPNMARSHNHAWNVTESIGIDLTLDQFKYIDTRVTYLPVDTPLLRRTGVQRRGKGIEANQAFILSSFGSDIAKEIRKRLDGIVEEFTH